jgi:hypothetical protein
LLYLMIFKTGLQNMTVKNLCPFQMMNASRFL